MTVRKEAIEYLARQIANGNPWEYVIQDPRLPVIGCVCPNLDAIGRYVRDTLDNGTGRQYAALENATRRRAEVLKARGW